MSETKTHKSRGTNMLTSIRVGTVIENKSAFSKLIVKVTDIRYSMLTKKTMVTFLYSDKLEKDLEETLSIDEFVSEITDLDLEVK